MTRMHTLDVRLVSVLPDHFKRPVLDVLLNRRVVHLASNESLGVEDGVVRIHGGLVLRCVADQAL